MKISKIHWTLKYIIILILFILSLNTIGWSQKKEKKAELLQKDYNKVIDVLVRINCNNRFQGSGSIIGILNNGCPLILTACHVVTKNYKSALQQYPLLPPIFYNEIFVGFGENSKEKKAFLLADSILIKYFNSKKDIIFSKSTDIKNYFDIRDDLALLISYPINTKNVIKYNKSDNIKPPQYVIAFGFPSGKKPKVTSGNIIKPHQKYFITDADIATGNSGGPLVDKYGRMIGIVNSVDEEEGYATQMNSILIVVENWLDELKKNKILKKKWERQKYARCIHRLWQDPKFIAAEILGLATLGYFAFKQEEPDLPGPPSFPTNPK